MFKVATIKELLDSKEKLARNIRSAIQIFQEEIGDLPDSIDIEIIVSEFIGGKVQRCLGDVNVNINV